MSQQRTSLVERLRQRASRQLSQAGMKAPRLQDRLLIEFERNVRHGFAPNDIQVRLHPNTYARLAPAIPAFRAEMLELLSEQCRAAGYQTPRKRQLTFVPEPALPFDVERIKVGFTYDPDALAREAERRTPSHETAGKSQESAAQPASPVPERVTHERPATGLRILLPGGERIPVPGVPFTIGRAPDNDLVLASFAVSRRHAELVGDGGGYVLRDLGSSNGLLVEGQHRDEIPVLAGTPVTIGDVDIRFETTGV